MLQQPITPYSLEISFYFTKSKQTQMETKASFMVHVQALGGKFLGPNAYSPTDIEIYLKLQSGNTYRIPYYQAGQDDGGISTNFTDGQSSFMPIIQVNPLNALAHPTVNYLTPGPQTVAGKTEIDLPPKLEIAELELLIPSPSTEKKLVFKQAVPLRQAFRNLHMSDPIVYKSTIVVPGLLVWNPVFFDNNMSIVVTMMCGCKISNDVNQTYWESSDFEVFAYVLNQDGSTETMRMQFNPHSPDSRFTSERISKAAIKSVVFTAQQKSTGNYGIFEYVL